MSSHSEARELLRANQVAEALSWAKAAARGAPGDLELRILLFELFALTGQWERAATQLEAAKETAPSALALAHVYAGNLGCETFRAAVFAGERAPHILGEPPEWLGLLTESVRARAQRKTDLAHDLQQRAFDAADTSSGSLDGESFQWIADGDGRLGPVLEIYLEGRYFWVPFDKIQKLTMEAPSDLRDLIWQPAQLTWSNGGQAAAFLPVRYPGTEQSEDGQLLLSRRTEWTEDDDGAYLGLGQRVLATDVQETALLDVRELLLQHDMADPAAGADPASDA